MASSRLPNSWSIRENMSFVKVLADWRVPTHLWSLVDTLALELDCPVVAFAHSRSCLTGPTLVHVIHLALEDADMSLPEQSVRMGRVHV